MIYQNLNNTEIKLFPGKPKRDFLNVDDLVEAIILVASIDKENFFNCLNGASHINVGSGKEISIKDLSKIISNVVGFEGALKFDSSKPDGTPRKILDISKLYSTCI